MAQIINKNREGGGGKQMHFCIFTKKVIAACLATTTTKNHKWALSRGKETQLLWETFNRRHPVSVTCGSTKILVGHGHLCRQCAHSWHEEPRHHRQQLPREEPQIKQSPEEQSPAFPPRLQQLEIQTSRGGRPRLVFNNFLEFLIQPINMELFAQVERFKRKIVGSSHIEQHSTTRNKG